MTRLLAPSWAIEVSNAPHGLRARTTALQATYLGGVLGHSRRVSLEVSVTVGCQRSFTAACVRAAPPPSASTTEVVQLLRAGTAAPRRPQS